MPFNWVMAGWWRSGGDDEEEQGKEKRRKYERKRRWNLPGNTLTYSQEHSVLMAFMKGYSWLKKVKRKEERGGSREEEDEREEKALESAWKYIRSQSHPRLDGVYESLWLSEGSSEEEEEEKKKRREDSWDLAEYTQAAEQCLDGIYDSFGEWRRRS